MDQTTHLSLPYIMPQQAQKHVTHNEALRELDAIIQLSVLDRDLAAPPSTPAEGDRYLVAAGASGGWSGHAGQLAALQDGVWRFYSAQPGWRVWVLDEGRLIALSGSAWITAGGEPINPAAMLGVLATADSTNRLSVKSDAVLFSHDDITPGTGDVRAVVNKAAASNTASLVFQDGFSGRAEFGLAGDDDFHLKVSPDGSSWNEALILKSSGRLSLPGAAYAANGTVATALSAVGPTGAHAAVQKWLVIDDGGTARYIPCF